MNSFQANRREWETGLVVDNVVGGGLERTTAAGGELDLRMESTATRVRLEDGITAFPLFFSLLLSGGSCVRPLSCLTLDILESIQVGPRIVSIHLKREKWATCTSGAVRPSANRSVRTPFQEMCIALRKDEAFGLLFDTMSTCEGIVGEHEIVVIPVLANLYREPRIRCNGWWK
jgi:hypothetical protein